MTNTEVSDLSRQLRSGRHLLGDAPNFCEQGGSCPNLCIFGYRIDVALCLCSLITTKYYTNLTYYFVNPQRTGRHDGGGTTSLVWPKAHLPRGHRVLLPRDNMAVGDKKPSPLVIHTHNTLPAQLSRPLARSDIRTSRFSAHQWTPFVCQVRILYTTYESIYMYASTHTIYHTQIYLHLCYTCGQDDVSIRTALRSQIDYITQKD